MEIEDHFPESAKHLLSVSGRELLRQLGIAALESVVCDVLMGVNIRKATESLTKRRVGLLNGALVKMYASLYESGIEPLEIPDLVRGRLLEVKDKDTQRILQWMVGMTQKQVQNVLRSDESEWPSYISSLQDGISDTAEEAEDMYGTMPLQVLHNQPSWEWALSLMMAAGSQTLAVRGSEKSLYGKFFEKMVLAAVLSTLGFSYTKPGHIGQRSFWLSERHDKRESDATAIWRLGQGVRFDIGFIGTGNSEITLDKVSRFERTVEMSGVSHYMRTFIIVDRVGTGSRVPALAEEIDGTIIQMSANDWALTLGDELEGSLDGYLSPLSGMSHKHYEAAVQIGVRNAPLVEVLGHHV
ncbi:MAG: CfrBI family restriction endonuclease [Acidimicrobiia bacterium]|nr:CfrBI family restriction endonuclease [Acidimicrobiia bacterium]MCY4458471.1 CfrBI family restriction endonuclease [Acidimicrobiaceae bacterium]